MRDVHIGVIVPSVNTWTEREWQALLPPGVHGHLGRIPVTQSDVSDDAATTTLLDQVRTGIDECVRSLSACRPDLIVMGMSAPVFYGGVEGARQFIDQLQAGTDIPIISTPQALGDALDLFGAKRIGILSPYQKINDDQVERYFGDRGFTVTSLRSVRSQTTRGIAETPEAELREMLVDLASTHVDALVQVGANLGLPHTETLERWLGVPILSLNATGLWAALRACGITDQFDGRGRLWREF